MTSPPSIEELADEISASRRHLLRAFMASTGRTPHSYIAELRLRQSIDLLRTTRLSATRIAFDCGFASSSHSQWRSRKLSR